MYMNQNGALCVNAGDTSETACPVCGSERIDDTGNDQSEGDEFMSYGFKCLACGAGGYKNHRRVFDGYTVTDIPDFAKQLNRGNDAGSLLGSVMRIFAEHDAALKDLQLMNDGSDHAPCETCLFGGGKDPVGPDCKKCCAPKSLWVWRGIANRAAVNGGIVMKMKPSTVSCNEMERSCNL